MESVDLTAKQVEIYRVFYNSSFGMFKRVGAPTFAELLEFRLHITRLQMILTFR